MAYFATTYRRILDKPENASLGINTWSEHVKSFGLGNYLNNDLYVGQKGRSIQLIQCLMLLGKAK